MIGDDDAASFAAWSDDAETFVDDLALQYLGDWWKLDFNATAFADFREAANATLDDDAWNAFDSAYETFTLTFEDLNWPYDGWEGAFFLMEADGTYYDVPGGGWLEEQSVTYEIQIDASLSYIIYVPPDCDNSQVSWSIADGSGATRVSGGACSLCTWDATSSSPLACAEDCDAPFMASDDLDCDDRRRRLANATAPSRAPSRAPTSLDNLFALDLRAASLGSTFDGAPEECYWSTLGDGTCDDENNNAYCGYDGEDCCVNTCASGSDDPWVNFERFCLRPASHKILATPSVKARAPSHVVAGEEVGV